MSDISDIMETYGQMNPYSDSFAPGEVIPQEAQLPGVMGFLESEGFKQFSRATNPLTLGGFQAFRSQNTLLYGGIGDDLGRTKKLLFGGRGKFSTFSRGALSPDIARGANQFVGGVNVFGKTTRRGRKLLAKQAAQGGKTPLTKGFLKNNRLNPRRLFRKNSVSEYLAGPTRNFYAPNSGGVFSSIGNMGAKDNPRFSGGMLGRLGALSKAERMSAAGKSTAMMDLNLARIANYNTFQTTALGVTPAVSGGTRAIEGPTRFDSLIGKAASGDALTVGERRYLMTQGVRGRYSQSIMRGMLTSGGGSEMFTLGGTAGFKTFGAGTLQASETAERILRPLAAGIEKNASFRMLAANSLGRAVPMTEFGSAQLGKELIEKGFVNTLGHAGAMKAVGAGGTRVGLAVAGEYALKAIPGVNMIFAADLAFQLAKLGGMAVKGAINFGKDAMKSMQGNINGGMFGTYKDDEVRATSRARGVMAIQNSRLNARSLLGSEGAMMAAHFG